MVRRLVLAAALASLFPFALQTRVLALDAAVAGSNTSEEDEALGDYAQEEGPEADPGSAAAEPAMPDPGDVEGEPYPPDGVTDPNVAYPTDGPGDDQGEAGAQAPEGTPKSAAAGGEPPD